MPPITNKDIINFEIAMNTMVNELRKFGNSQIEFKTSIDTISKINSTLVKHQQLLIEENQKANSLLKILYNKSENDIEKSMKKIETSIKDILLENNKTPTKPKFSFINVYTFPIYAIIIGICINATILIIQSKNENTKKDAMKYIMLMKFSNPKMKQQIQKIDSVLNTYTIEQMEERVLKK